MSKLISFRLRKIDTDLENAIGHLNNQELSELCRSGLRIMLGIRTTKVMEVREREISIPEIKKTTSLQSKPAVFRPQNKL